MERKPTSMDRHQYQDFCSYCLYPPSFDEWFEKRVKAEVNAVRGKYSHISVSSQDFIDQKHREAKAGE